LKIAQNTQGWAWHRHDFWNFSVDETVEAIETGGELDARIAEEAAVKTAAAAKAEAEKTAAEDAAKAREAAEAKLKEAEEAVAKAKKEAEEAAAKAAEATKEAEEAKKAAVPPPPPEEKKAPVRFHDAIGRKFNFPFHICTKWTVRSSFTVIRILTN
jgi:seryl-tRNA synthetase